MYNKEQQANFNVHKYIMGGVKKLTNIFLGSGTKARLITPAITI